MGDHSMATILIVDDAKFIRLTLANILEKENHEVVGEAENGEEALQLYQQLKPDLVFMDITMPIMNGVEATKKIIEKDPNAIIIICSAMGQHKIVVSAIEAGAKDFIVKPFDENRVLETVQQFI